MLCLGQDFWGTPVSLYPNLQILGAKPNLSDFYLLNRIQFLGSFGSFFIHFELDVYSFGSRRGADDNGVVLLPFSSNSIYFINKHNRRCMFLSYSE